MAYQITSACTGCGKCKETCPVEAITQSDGAIPYVIDAATCVDCGQCVDACPVSAIKEK